MPRKRRRCRIVVQELDDQPPPATAVVHGGVFCDAAAAAAAANLLTATPDEAAILVACALDSSTDLLHLAVACRRFALKWIAAPAAPPLPHAATAEMLSIAEEVARRWVADCTEQERGWVPRRGWESWLGLMWEVQLLRRAVFGRSHEWVTLLDGGAVATQQPPPVTLLGGGDPTAHRRK
jgi:hypothetical protein